ncbi:hypothetical protein [Chryseobacterium sp.]|nr:hypothetical protein [Chryseobacterium sp.]
MEGGKIQEPRAKTKVKCKKLSITQKTGETKKQIGENKTTSPFPTNEFFT